MSKILRSFIVSLLLACIIVASFAGAAFAAKGDGPARNGDCDCTACGDGPPWLLPAE